MQLVISALTADALNACNPMTVFSRPQAGAGRRPPEIERCSFQTLWMGDFDPPRERTLGLTRPAVVP
jgi:hypothetical protein